MSQFDISLDASHILRRGARQVDLIGHLGGDDEEGGYNSNQEESLLIPHSHTDSIGHHNDNGDDDSQPDLDSVLLEQP
jgi:hypothetical protein